MTERGTLLEIHDALLLALDATEDAPTCAEHFAEAHGYVRQALIDVVDMLRERAQLAPFGVPIH